MRNGIAKLVRRGALLVAATGNSNANGGTRLRYPARLPHVIAVGDMEGQALLPGPELDLLAPGGNLWTPTVGQVWKPIGPAQTSYATPLVSGAAAARVGRAPRRVGADGAADRLAPALHGDAREDAGRASRGFGTVDVGAALRFPPRMIPPDDELEPNDSATEASSRGALPPLACFKACTRRGIVGKTDDPEDWWPVRIPGGRKVCRQVGGAVHSSVVQGPKGLAYVRITTTRPQAAYTLKVRAGRNC